MEKFLKVVTQGWHWERARREGGAEADRLRTQAQALLGPAALLPKCFSPQSDWKPWKVEYLRKNPPKL